MTAKTQAIQAIKDYIYTDKYMGVRHYFLERSADAPKIKYAKQDRVKLLQDLEKKLKACKKCVLYKSRKNLVFGQGSPSAKLMFVGEAPGHEEDLQGLPFVGKAGQLLTKIIEAIGLKRSDVYIANVLKCRPPENRNPEPDEIQSCEENLLSQIQLIGPKVVVCLGKFSAQTLLKTQTPISALRGKFYDYHGVKLMPTFHPAYLLRNPNDKKLVWQDMQKVVKELSAR